jgi:outer membrane immunogenic protein
MGQKMKKIFLSGLALGVLIAPAAAADVAPYFGRSLQTPFVSWTGFYVGANAGWIGSDYSINNGGSDTGTGGLGAALAIGAIPSTIKATQSGFLGGGQIGYNWQVYNWILGVETDFDGASAKSSVTAAFPGTAAFAPITTVYNSEIDSLGTLRARLGFLWPASVLWYATAGLAYGQTKFGTAAVCPAFAPPCSSEGSTALQSSKTAVGWTAGTGVEWQFTPAWSVKAEYLYVDLGNQTNTIVYSYGANTSSLISTVSQTENIVRFGVNYKLF